MNNTLTVYRASAGSGKTVTLAVEYIAIVVASPDANEFRHILAVTFTNKATGEMKDRILQHLYGIGFALKGSDLYLTKVHERLSEWGVDMPDVLIRHKAQVALTAILHDYSAFRVETIDSFFQSIVRNLAHELGLTANLQVDLNTADLITRAVDRLMDSLSDGQDELKTWIMDFVYSQLEENKSWKIKKSVNNLAQCIFEEEYQKRSKAERDALDDKARIKAFRQQMFAIQRDAKTEIEARANTVIEQVRAMSLDYARISHGDRWLSFAQKIANMEQVEMSVTMKACIVEPASMLKKTDVRDDALLEEATKVAILYEKLYADYRCIIQRYNTAKLASRYINELRLLGYIEALCTEIAGENNQFTLSKTPALLHSMVQGSDAPFVYERAGIKFRHIMIDEFQDTSRMQWSNFRTLLLENQSKGGRDLIVGDIKQSIYRWRNGDWSILHGIRDAMHLPARAIRPLSYNYRSTQHVVDFNNDFFPIAAQLLDSIDVNCRFKIKDIYEDVHQLLPPQTLSDEGHVRVHLYSTTNNDYLELEAAVMLEQIHSLHTGGLGYDKMAILVRRNDDAVDLIKRFREMDAGVQLISDEAFLLSSSTAVQMIIATLRMLTDTDMHSPVNMRFLVQTYQQAVCRESLPADTLYMDDYYDLLPSELLQHRQQLLTEPLHLLCEKIYRLLRLDCLEGQSAYMMAFMDEVLTFVQNDTADIASFLQAWDETISHHSIPSSQLDGIRIVTIHKSKGLEFHTVFLPRMSEAIESDKHNMELWCRADDDTFNALGALPIRVGNDMGQSLYSSYYEEEHLQRRVDALNIMYVAFTRAECNLYVWGTYREPKKGEAPLSEKSTVGNLLKLYLHEKATAERPSHDEWLWQLGIPVIQRKKANEKQNEHNRLTPDMPNVEQQFVSYEPNLHFLQSNASKHFINQLRSNDGESRQEAWEVGLIVHRILSMIRTADDIPQSLADCQREGLITNEGMAQRIVEQLQKGFALPQVQAWFAPDAECFSECTIAACDEVSGEPIVRRPDRVVMSADDVFVVDYKLGTEHVEHHLQVATYMALLRRMYPKKNVSGALWYILRNKVVTVKA